MLVLALDSSTRIGSLALALDGRILESRLGDPTVRQAIRLPGDLVALLAAHGYVLADVDLFAAAAGPGGFTGLRVGLATMQGLAMALDRRVYLASTLELLGVAGRTARPEARWIGTWMQGMRGEVFTALYVAAAEPQGLVAILDPLVGTPDEAADAWRDAAPAGPIVVVGDAWPDAGEPLRARFGAALDPVVVPVLAEVLALQAGTRSAEAVAPAAIRPAYVRRPDAVLTRLQAGLPVSGDV